MGQMLVQMESAGEGTGEGERGREEEEETAGEGGKVMVGGAAADLAAGTRAAPVGQ